MDLQTAFYTIGIIFYVVFTLFFVFVAGFALSTYLKYRRIYLKTKRRVEKFKEAIPILSIIAEKLHEMKKKRKVS